VAGEVGGVRGVWRGRGVGGEGGGGGETRVEQ